MLYIDLKGKALHTYLIACGCYSIRYQGQVDCIKLYNELHSLRKKGVPIADLLEYWNENPDILDKIVDARVVLINILEGK